jgi:hypothetical protein
LDSTENYSTIIFTSNWATLKIRAQSHSLQT